MNPSRVTRRRLLGGIGLGAAVGLGGCVTTGPHSCGASGPIEMDDVLRVTVEGIQSRADGFRWEAVIWQPGPARGPYGDRDRGYQVSYSGVRFRAFAIDGTAIVDRAMGDFEPGDRTTESVETDRFPAVVTARPSGASGGYDEGCVTAVPGADLRAYIGFRRRPLEPWFVPYYLGPEPERRALPSFSVPGHAWLPIDLTRPGTEQLPRSAFIVTVCLQRRAAGNPPAFETFELVPGHERWLRRAERYRVGLATIPVPDEGETREPAEIPTIVPQLAEAGGTRNGIGPHDEALVTEVSRGEFLDAYRGLEGTGASAPLPKYCEWMDGEGTWCTNHFPGHCEAGNLGFRYAPGPAISGGPTEVLLEYTWDGPTLPEGLERPQ